MFMNDTNQFVERFDTICFSHLRWDFVWQRPQHLMGRFARDGRVFVFEEPIFEGEKAHYTIESAGTDLWIIKPRIPNNTAPSEVVEAQRAFLNEIIETYSIDSHISWYYTPMMYEWSKHLQPEAVVYDCMDELSGFLNAPDGIRQREAELMDRADLVFTGGRSLYEAKKHRHENIHPFPSSIDFDHFYKARRVMNDPADLNDIPGPRIVFVGVIDERMDVGLLDQIAAFEPACQFVLIGPIVKIDEGILPRRSNIHYLGQKKYDDLPGYLGRCDAAIMPFALNDSTRFISPTKTPEYLAAGLPVVSTPIYDVVHPYGEKQLVRIAATPEEFGRAIRASLAEDADRRKAEADNYLSGMSWNRTYTEMRSLIETVIDRQIVPESQMTAAAVTSAV